MVLPASDETLVRRRTRGHLLCLLEKEVILTRLVLGARGVFRAYSQDWSAYWEPVMDLASRQLCRRVNSFGRVWREYIRTGFDAKLRQHYCFEYFLLLQEAIRDRQGRRLSRDDRRVLQRIVGFECFALEAAGGDGVQAAGTTVLRNPCYLVAKLRRLGDMENPQSLPLITIPSGEAALFWNYRQQKLSVDSSNPLLLYIAHGSEASFPIINALQRQMGHGTDPWSAERSRRISRRTIIPYLQNSPHVIGTPAGAACDIEFVDVGAGSGLLLAKICRSVRSFLISQRKKASFRAWLTDISPGKPSRFFRRTPMLHATDTIVCSSADYRRWLDGATCLPPRRGVRVALLSRVVDTLSTSQIIQLPAAEYGRVLGLQGLEYWWPGCLPTHCLRPGGTGPASLVASGARMSLASGRSFAQASLSPYYEGISMLSPKRGKQSVNLPGRSSVFLPLRRFCPASLWTSAGASVIEKLLSTVSLLIIEDADLRPEDLRTHLSRASMAHVVAIDMTCSLNLSACSSYALLHKNDPAIPALPGERLW